MILGVARWTVTSPSPDGLVNRMGLGGGAEPGATMLGGIESRRWAMVGSE